MTAPPARRRLGTEGAGEIPDDRGAPPALAARRARTEGDAPPEKPSAPAGDAVAEGQGAAASGGRLLDREGLERELPPRLARRLPILLAVLVLAHTWLQQHFDVELSEELLAAGALGALLPLGRALWGYARDSVERDVRVLVRRSARLLLGAGVLTALTLVVVLVGSTVSSVTVMAAGAPGPLRMRVLREGVAPAVPLEQDERARVLAGSSDVQRALAFTAPLGSPYYLEVEGYQRHSFDVLPWTGARVRVAEDLRRLPSVLVRVPLGKQALLPDGRIELHLVGGGSAPRKLAEAPTDADHGAALFGHPAELPPHFVETWKRELRVGKVEERDMARPLLLWERPARASAGSGLEPGRELEARFVAGGGSVQARARFEVGAAPVSDVLLEPEEDP